MFFALLIQLFRYQFLTKLGFAVSTIIETS